MIATTSRPKRSRITEELTCRECGRTFRSIDRDVCHRCRQKLKLPTRVSPITAIQMAPYTPEHCPEWLKKADWGVVESSWVALMVEMFHDDAPGTVAVLARSLAIIRKRYRELGAPRNRNAHAP